MAILFLKAPKIVFFRLVFWCFGFDHIIDVGSGFFEGLIVISVEDKRQIVIDCNGVSDMGQTHHGSTLGT